jgi:putative hydrolase of the HAD superfamily
VNAPGARTSLEQGGPRAGPVEMRIVFDFAGVLFHWQPRLMLRRVLPHRAVDAASAARLEREIFEGYGGDWADFDRGRVEVAELVQRIAARTGLPAQDIRAVVDAVPAELQPLPAMVSVVQRLHAAGRRLHFLSNMPHTYAEHLEREHPFLRCFESGVISARVQQIKPEPEIFATASRLFAAVPAELLFIDDVALNVDAARAAGWRALQFVDAADCELQLRAAGFW